MNGPYTRKRSSTLTQLIHTIQPYLHQYGYLAVFAAIFLEDFGVPMPGETMLIAASLLAPTGALNIYLLIAVAWAAAVLGDNTGYAIGRFGGRRLVLSIGKYLFLTPKRLAYAERFFERRGAAVVIIARFIEVLRQLNGIIAGIVEMSWLKFLLYNAIGAGLWVGTWSTLFYLLGRKAEQYGSLLKKLQYVLLGALGLALIVWLVVRLCRRRSHPVET
ncbi:DedA family protein [Salinispira pacifica]